MTVGPLAGGADSAVVGCYCTPRLKVDYGQYTNIVRLRAGESAGQSVLQMIGE
jgi:hypothetical protein